MHSARAVPVGWTGPGLSVSSSIRPWACLGLDGGVQGLRAQSLTGTPPATRCRQSEEKLTAVGLGGQDGHTRASLRPLPSSGLDARGLDSGAGLYIQSLFLSPCRLDGVATVEPAAEAFPGRQAAGEHGQVGHPQLSLHHPSRPFASTPEHIIRKGSSGAPGGPWGA